MRNGLDALGASVVGHGGGHHHGGGWGGGWWPGPWPVPAPVYTVPVMIDDLVDDGDEIVEIVRGLDILGDLSDTSTDYDFGEAKVVELLQFFNALGRPLEWEADVEKVYAAYENARVSPVGKVLAVVLAAPTGLLSAAGPSVLKWYKSTAMKQVGSEAAKLIDEIRKAGAHRGTTGTAAGTAPAKGVGPAGKSDVYEPTKYTPPKLPSLSIPWWVWLIVAGAGLSLVGYFVIPIIASSAARRTAARALTG